jgi:protein-tyrosine phosphatase
MPTRCSVCFVCLGNICRSPTAEGVFRDLVERAGLTDVIAIDSAGTAAYHSGEPPDKRSAAAARNRGITLGGRARQFMREDFTRFDHIVAMDRANFRDLCSLAPDDDARAKVELLRHYDPDREGTLDDRDADVPDPYYGGDRGFADVLDICTRSCTAFLDHLRREHGL